MERATPIFSRFALASVTGSGSATISSGRARDSETTSRQFCGLSST